MVEGGWDKCFKYFFSPPVSGCGNGTGTALSCQTISEPRNGRQSFDVALKDPQYGEECSTGVT